MFTLSSDNAITAIQGGSIDWAAGGTVTALPILRTNPSIKMLTVASSGHDGIFMRADTAPFNDKRVRQAMALCIDRPGMIKSVEQGLGVLGNDNVIAPTFPVYNPIPQRQQNYAEAKALLAAAGHPNGFKVTLTTSSDTSPLVLVATVARQESVEACRHSGHDQARAIVGLLQYRLAADAVERHELGNTPRQASSWAPRIRPAQCGMHLTGRTPRLTIWSTNSTPRLT